MKRCKLVTAAATAAMVGILGFSAPAFAASGYGNVEVKTDAGKSITIGNDAFARTFSFKDGKLKTTLIDNKLGKSQFVPGEKSEEFFIEGMFESARQEPQNPLTSVKSGGGSTVSVTAKASATHENECPKGAAGAIDGDVSILIYVDPLSRTGNNALYKDFVVVIKCHDILALKAGFL